jgi:hypothetical protein
MQCRPQKEPGATESVATNENDKIRQNPTSSMIGSHMGKVSLRDHPG